MPNPERFRAQFVPTSSILEIESAEERLAIAAFAADSKGLEMNISRVVPRGFNRGYRYTFSRPENVQRTQSWLEEVEITSGGHRFVIPLEGSPVPSDRILNVTASVVGTCFLLAELVAYEEVVEVVSPVFNPLTIQKLWG